jgi:hypothetical protein
MRTAITLCTVCAFALAWPSDREKLLEGVGTIVAPGVPGALATFGDFAEPLVVGRAVRGVLAPAVAFARMGRGRIVAFGHDGYFGGGALADPGTGRLMRNAATWLRGGAHGPAGVVARPDLAAFLRDQGFEVREIGAGDDPRGFSVVAMVHEPLTRDQQTRLKRFVREGGGLLLASTGWGWRMITGRRIDEHPLNAITEPAGLVWTDGMLERTVQTGFDASAAIPGDVHAGRALEALGSEANPQALASVLAAGLNLSDRESAFRDGLRALREQASDAAMPTASSPVTSQEPKRRLALALDTADMQRAPVSGVVAHPAAEAFPGRVSPDAPRIARDVRVDPARPGWLSLGLYAAPGERIIVRVPADWAGRGLQVQIGAHTDELWGLDTWRRAPAIVRSFPIGAPETLAANAFGGLVYLVVPEGARGEPFQAAVEGAVEAPLFVLGHTTLAEWRGRIRGLPAPWAELATSKLVLTVPSGVVRALDDPEALLRFWDRVMDACADLAAWPRERARPERIVADEQISAGYMHAGYPIMTHLDAASLAVDLRRLSTEGSWGHFHEIGHNHQSPDWTFDGTIEVTVNLFTTYVYTQVLGQGLYDGHPAIRDRAARVARAQRHVADGAPFDVWKGDPFLALLKYLQVIEAFGWDPIKRTLAEYRALPERERPRTDDEKRDQWLRRLSRSVGRDLSGFFQRWGIPTSAEARASLSDLPAWMPREFEAGAR